MDDTSKMVLGVIWQSSMHTNQQIREEPSKRLADTN
jgi:hypothetical protein